MTEKCFKKRIEIKKHTDRKFRVISYRGDQHFSDFLPTRRHQSTEGKYTTVNQWQIN